MAEFSGAKFTGNAEFHQATFIGWSRFDGVTFIQEARFDEATLALSTSFDETTFDCAVFDGATFTGGALFRGATFVDDGMFGGVTFEGEVSFRGATFAKNADFEDARFEAMPRLGPLLCQKILDLSGVVFSVPVTVEAAAAEVRCLRARWVSTGALRLRYASVDLGDAVVEYPLSISSHSSAFAVDRRNTLDESALVGLDTGVRITSLTGMDAAHLVLTDVDLSRCLFAGAVNLDQLHLEGDCRFALPPLGIHWRRLRPVRFTRRATLAEEHDWRARQPHAAPGWTPISGRGPVGPTQLAPVYRALRKSFEDSKNEPGAGDFYYGEMEMRRQNPGAPGSERSLLTAYWALSGYGLRATRTLMWLLLAMTATLLVMMLWGLPANPPKLVSTGKISGKSVRLTTDTPDPANPSGPLHERISTERFEKGLRVVINSVVFRSSGQDLTTVGTYAEMACRFTEPVLLGLAVLAIRNRVKR